MQEKIAIIVNCDDKKTDLSNLVHNSESYEIWSFGNFKKSHRSFNDFYDFINYFSNVWKEYSWTVHLNSRLKIDAKNTEKLLNAYFNFRIPVNATGELEWPHYDRQTIGSNQIMDINCRLPQSSINCLSHGAWEKIFSNHVWRNGQNDLFAKNTESIYGLMCYAHKIPVSNVCFLTTKKLSGEFTLNNKDGKCSLIGA